MTAPRREAGAPTHEQGLTPDRPRLGWPWCGDVPTGGEHRGDAIATQHDDGTITLATACDHIRREHSDTGRRPVSASQARRLQEQAR